MSYQAPKLSSVSLKVELSDFDGGKDTASCCDSSCCYGYGDSSCSSVFWS